MKPIEQTNSTPDQIAAHNIATQAAFAYLRKRDAIGKLAEPCTVYGTSACMYVGRDHTTLGAPPAPKVQCGTLPIRFVRCAPCVVPDDGKSLLQKLLAALKMFGRIIAMLLKP